MLFTLKDLEGKSSMERSMILVAKQKSEEKFFFAEENISLSFIISENIAVLQTIRNESKEMKLVCFLRAVLLK